MSIWIKICGNTSLEDAQLAADAGADAVGFVFAPSPRRVTPAQVAAIVPHLPATLEKFGVFVDASFEEIDSTVRAAGLTGVQLHFDAPPNLPARIRARFGSDLRILRVIHFSPESTIETAGLLLNPDIDAVLVDSRTPRRLAAPDSPSTGLSLPRLSSKMRNRVISESSPLAAWPPKT